MKFKSRKDIGISVVVFGINSLLVSIIIYGLLKGDIPSSNYIAFFVISVVIVLLFWIFLDTAYKLDRTYFYYKSGPFRGKIAITRIKEVVVHTTVYTGFRPATAPKGILVKYDKYEEIYISPKTNDSFVAALKELKHDIIITQRTP